MIRQGGKIRLVAAPDDIGPMMAQETTLQATTAIYVRILLAVCAVALVVSALVRRRAGARSSANKDLLNAIIERQSAGSRLNHPGTFGSSGLATAPPRAAQPGSQLAALEGHLRTAILDAGARERLVRDAMRVVGGNRAAAIRKVLHDLHDEDKRWS